MSLSPPATQGKPFLKIFPLQMKKLVSPLARSLYLDLSFFTTKEANGEQLTLAYFGMNQGRARFWGKRICGPEAVESSGTRTWVWNVEAAVSQQRPDCQMILVETNALSELTLTGKPGFRLPMWIQLALDCSKPFEELRRASFRLRDIPRNIRRNKLAYQLSSAEPDLEYFIDTMHLPFIARQHGNTAFISSKQNIHEAFKKSELLYLTHEGQRIAGGLLHYENGTATLCYSGVRDPLPEALNKAWGEAYYYFGLQRAMERQMSCFSMGGTSPFLTDSLTYFKLSFKPFVMQESNLPDHFVKLMFHKRDAALDAFLRDHPFIACPRQGVHERHVVVNEADITTAGQLQDIFKKIHCAEITRTVIHVQGDLEKMRALANECAAGLGTFTLQKWDISHIG